MYQNPDCASFSQTLDKFFLAGLECVYREYLVEREIKGLRFRFTAGSIHRVLCAAQSSMLR